MLKQLLQTEKGSVMLEFCLVLPIYLLIFGGTFLIFDISMGKLHLQESNRNLAWLQDDRYNNSDRLINTELYKRVTAYYDARNELEKQWDATQAVWSFGSKEAVETANQQCIAEYRWGHELPEGYSDDTLALEVNRSWADTLGLSGVLDNEYLTLYSGNMFLNMDKISAVYIGAIGVSSVLFPAEYRGQETVPLYKAAYTFTRKFAEDEDGKKNTAEAARNNGEMLILRRKGTDRRNEVHNVNDLFWQNIIFKSWPSNGPFGDIRIFLGM